MIRDWVSEGEFLIHTLLLTRMGSEVFRTRHVILKKMQCTSVKNAYTFCLLKTIMRLSFAFVANLGY